MPNTKSAERRSRNSARKCQLNKSRKSKVKTLVRRFDELIKGGKKEEATATLPLVASALDKAAKTGVIHRRNADRKKSRLALKLAVKK